MTHPLVAWAQDQLADALEALAGKVRHRCRTEELIVDEFGCWRCGVCNAWFREEYGRAVVSYEDPLPEGERVDDPEPRRWMR